ncbi:MAG: sec-independent protein translocase protein TatB [Gammaproteobacteria bacterium]|jgi:sec-independent protein translocase protein TatB
MFDMGFTEIVLIGIVALVVIGPERLPGAAITVGKYVGRLKRFVNNVRSDVESELKTDEIRKLIASQQEELSSLKETVKEASKGLDMSDASKSIDDSMASVLGKSEVENPPPAETNESTKIETSAEKDVAEPGVAPDEKVVAESELADTASEQKKSTP